LPKGRIVVDTDGSVIFARWRWCGSPSNTCFLGPTRVHIPNGTSIGSAVFVRLRTVTNRPADRPRYSVCNGRLHLRT